MLLYDTKKRITAADALNHPYFKSDPLPCLPSQLPRFKEDFHEYTVRLERSKEENLAKESQNSENKSRLVGTNLNDGIQKGLRNQEVSLPDEPEINLKPIPAIQSKEISSKYGEKDQNKNEGEGLKIVRKRLHSDDNSFKVPLDKPKLFIQSSDNAEPVPDFIKSDLVVIPRDKLNDNSNAGYKSSLTPLPTVNGCNRNGNEGE